MNSRSKPTRPRNSGTRTRKPATIDLEAKKVADEPDTKTQAAAKTTPTVKSDTASKPLGRDGATQSAKQPAASGATGATDTKKPEASKQTSGAKASTSSTKAAEPTAAPVEKSGGGGMLSALGGAAAAVIGLGAIGQFDGAQSIPLIGSIYGANSEQSTSTDYSGDIASLSEQIETLKSSSTPVDLAPINERLAKIEEAGTSGGTDDATTNRLADVEKSLAEVSQSVSAITNAAQDGVNTSSEEISIAIADLSQRLEKLEGSVGELASASDGPSEETTSKITGIEAKLAELASVPATDLTPLENKLSEIETSLSSINETVSANASSVEALNSQSSTLQETVASVKASEKVARSVAVNALGAALENDDPIALAIASIESLGGKTKETQRLAELSKQGVPSQKDLLAELNAFTNTVQNPVADTQSGSITDKFWANAQNLVSFRSTGPQEGDSAIAVLSRVKANLETGDLSGVLSEWENLPSETRQSGEEWIAKVNQRVEAFTLFNTLSDNLSAQAG